MRCNVDIYRLMLKSSRSLLLALSVVLAGCANNSLTGDTYSRDEARQVQQVQYGRILSVRPVIIEGDREGIVGNVGGTVIGGVAGNSVGGGNGQTIATVIGAAVGGILGQAAEERATRRQGQELTLEMDNGEVLSVVQEVKDNVFFAIDDRVKLLKLNGTARVSY